LIRNIKNWWKKEEEEEREPQNNQPFMLQKEKLNWKPKKKSITIHEPSTIRGYVSFGYDKVQISEDLYNFKKFSMFVSTVNLYHKMKRLVPSRTPRIMGDSSTRIPQKRTKTLPL